MSINKIAIARSDYDRWAAIFPCLQIHTAVQKNRNWLPAGLVATILFLDICLPNKLVTGKHI
jgi:hypothetical protein